jgi:glycyl-tRNA synthetase beta chain
MADFLFEIGLEEIPARMIAGAQAELLRRVVGMLERERLVAAGVEAESYSTPRRLAVLVRGVALKQEDLSEEVLGPAVKIAFPKGKDAEPGPAAVAFARKSGVDVAALKIVETPKGEYIAASSVKPGKSAAEVITIELPKELAAIYWAKNMYWRPGKPERFVRPVRWMVALLGDDIVPVSFGGYEAGRNTYGHRVLFGDAAIEVASPASYVEQLSAAFAMADVELRRHTIRKALDRVCRTISDTRWREDHALVDKMTNMTEWPSVIAGAFEPEYLELPEEVLVTVMRDHQNYFAVESKDGKLAPHFLAILNTVADEAGEAVIRHGNERVLRARFNDARFFWEFDQRVLLKDRVALLENVTFQKDLGSYAEKDKRVMLLLRSLLALLQGSLPIDTLALETAAQIAKTDLTTELVKEFTELQGIVGGRYALFQGHGPVVGGIIYDQYLPHNMEDDLPRSVEAKLYAISDRMETVASMFAIGLEPTGSRDPLGLRRAANGVVKILAESDLPLSFSLLLSMSTMSTVPGSFGNTDKFEKFMTERLEFYLEEVRGYRYDLVKAVLAAKPPRVVVPANDPLAAMQLMGSVEVTIGDITKRAGALWSMRDSEDFLAVCAAFKRIRNILDQAVKSGETVPSDVFTGYFRDPAESDLESKAGLLKRNVDVLTSAKDYRSALERIATLRPQVDAFFGAVMVMDPDGEVRANRLALLARVQSISEQIADFSEIVVGG